MDALGIIAILVLLITIFIVLKNRKKCSSCPPKEAQTSKHEDPELNQQVPETKSVVNAEPGTVNSQMADAPVVTPPEPKSTDKPIVNLEPSAPPQVKETVTPPIEDTSYNLPQDSILRRHYLTHVCTMIESLAPVQPTESVLCRHYHTMTFTTLAHCLSNKNAMEQLIADYQINKPIVSIEPTKVRVPTKVTLENNSSLPQDSILRRHYLAHVCNMIESLAPLRPTESVLSRHYDMMIVAKLGQCLSNKKAMEQLTYAYEHEK
ncbi:MAG: hypothetical protein ISR72_09185 [Methylobacter sp.]|nr:hypothetical protein [Methylobacter sp.]